MSFERLPESRLSAAPRRAALAAPGLWIVGVVLAAAPASAQSVNHCASIYGPGFAPLAGSPTCVRIGGRVRVESALGASGGAWRVAPEAGSASRAATPGLGAGFAHGDAGRVRLPRRF